MKPSIKIIGLLAALVVGLTSPLFSQVPDLTKGSKSAGNQPQAATSVRLVLPADATPVVRNLGSVLTRQIQQRCEAKVGTGGEAQLMVEMAIEQGIGKEGFRIEDRKGGGVRIVGNDERGVVYGVGKFLRTSRYDRAGFAPGTWRGTSVPQKPVRGIYFATHFNNFYHDAPIEEVERYVEDLGLWGFNTVAFWYDMRYAGGGFDDPDAVHLRARLTRIGQAAKRIGLDVGMFFVANDSYQSAPADIRADAGGMRGAIYPWNVCPSKPEGLKYSLKVLGEEFDWAAPLQPAYVVCWPYDSGGCGCKDCRPWGSNGFLKLSEQLAAMAREKLPGTKFVLSTWMFDKDEWKNAVAGFAERMPFFDFVMAEPAAGPIPGGVPWMGFPEISMHNTFPWGGFGATPLTGLAQGQWNRVKATSSGGFPYSEGIFEDLTKVVISQFYWNDQPAAETVKEYIRRTTIWLPLDDN